LRILNVNMSINSMTGGGTAERTFQMSRSLVNAGIECIVLTTSVGLSPDRVKAMKGIEMIVLPCLNKRFYIPKFSYKHIINVVASADLVHLMGHWTLVNALVYFAARRLKKPYVVCPAGALPLYGRSKIKKIFYNRIIGYRMIHDANGHVAITEGEIKNFNKYGVKKEQISLIPNGIDAGEFQEKNDAEFRRKFGLSNHPFILFVGRLNAIKGPDILLDAFCLLKDRFPEPHLVFAGPDEGMLRQLKMSAEKAGVTDRIHFIDYIGGMDKSRAYHASDFLVIPSRQEAMSIVVLEAGITETPVLLTDQCGFDVAGIGGGIVVPASVDGVRAGLQNILQDSTKTKDMGRNLKTYVEKHFLWDAIVYKYLDLYGRILNHSTATI